MQTRALIAVVVLVGATLVTSCTATSRLKGIARETAKLNDQLGKLRGELQSFAIANGAGTNAIDSSSSSDSEDTDLKTLVDVEARITSVGGEPTAQALAECLNEIDGWLIQPDQEESVIVAKQKLAQNLRQQVKKEVVAIQKACLESPNGSEAIKRHGEAAQVLVLYPMADDPNVLSEAKALSEQQVNLATRIDVLRRQRYNQWACKQIESAIDGYNSGSSYWSPKKENPVLMKSLVRSLGEVDPGLLEPAVMELYNYIIDLTKGSISATEKVELAKRLTDPTINRKTLGDF